MEAVKCEAAFQAAREGDVDGVRACLEGGIEADMVNPRTGRTLLHVACRQGYPEVASLLLSNGANPGAVTLRHLTPLHLACHQGHLKVARLLLEAWAPVDDRDIAGTAPLHLSAQMGHIDVVRLLLQCGAERDAQDESGWTPIFFASWKGHAAVVHMLLQAGSNARVSDRRDNVTPLHLACCWGHLEVAKVLLEFGADSSAKDSNGAFPDGVIGDGSPSTVDPACARQLSEVVAGHRSRIKGAPSSLECVVDSLRSKVSELEDQLERSRRNRLEVMAYASDENRSTFSAALRPECPVCQVEVKEAVLDPCRHLAACASCADSLQSCSFCSCPVRGYQLLESRQVYERKLAWEDEVAGLRAQSERFSRRVRDLVAGNGRLKLDVRRARAEVLVLIAERQGLEQRFLLRTPSPPSTSHEVDTASIITDNSVGGFEGGEGNKPHSKFILTREESTGAKISGDGGVSGKEWQRKLGVVRSGGGSSAGASLDESNVVVHDCSVPDDAGDISVLRSPFVCAMGNGRIGRVESNRSQFSTEGANTRLKLGDVGASSNDDLSNTERDGENDARSCISPNRFTGSTAAFNTGHATDGAVDVDIRLDLDLARLAQSERAFSSRSLRPSRTYSGSDENLGVASVGSSGVSAETMRPVGFPGPSSVAGEGVDIVTNSRNSRTDMSNAGEVNRADVDSTSDDGDRNDRTIICEIRSEMWPSASFIDARASAEDIGDGENNSTTGYPAPGGAQAVATGSDLPTGVTGRRRGNVTHTISHLLNESCT